MFLSLNGNDIRGERAASGTIKIINSRKLRRCEFQRSSFSRFNNRKKNQKIHATITFDICHTSNEEESGELERVVAPNIGKFIGAPVVAF